MSEQNQFLLYTAADGAVKVDVYLKDETVWLTQKALAELFGVQVPGINKHLKNIFESGELVEESVISILETTAADEKNYQTRYYNLDPIIAVGYRVNSFQATQFRIWATKTLREFILPRPSGEPGGTRRRDENGGLGDFPAQLSRAVELPDTLGQGEGERSGSKTKSLGRIRSLPPATGRGFHLGL